jgi:uncharacterized membrane protein YdbT with pleckstrin-like domain
MEHGNFGKKTFIFFVLRRSGFFFLCILIFLGLFLITDVIPGAIQSYLRLIDFLFILFLILTLGITVGIGYLEYHNFTISVLDRNIKITRGIINRHEVGIPYKAIDRVDIVRTLIYQIFGISDLVVHVASNDAKGGEETVALSFLEKGLAEEIQREILKRSQVEHIKDVDLNPQRTM